MKPAGKDVPRSRRVIAFGAIVLATLMLAAGYAWHVSKRDAAARPTAPSAGTASLAVSIDPARPQLVYRSTALGDGYGRVAFRALDDPASAPVLTPLSCERVHFAAGHGVCLVSHRGLPTTYAAELFNDRFEVVHRIALAGPPSRARMSPDGRLAAFTVFVSGHAYSNPGFTTRTSIVDAASGRAVAEDLEAFELLQGGRQVAASDRNFWGVSFSPDGARFVATVGTGGAVMLVEGDIRSRRMQVIHDDVECPSWSPDGGRVAFKRRSTSAGTGRVLWRLHVLELASGKETALATETRNVDDQVEWLNDREIVYAMPDDAQAPTAATQLWALAVDGRSPPRAHSRFAYSPAVVNRGASR
jgi:hypothetical protein